MDNTCWTSTNVLILAFYDCFINIGICLTLFCTHIHLKRHIQIQFTPLQFLVGFVLLNLYFSVDFFVDSCYLNDLQNIQRTHTSELICFWRIRIVASCSTSLMVSLERGKEYRIGKTSNETYPSSSMIYMFCKRLPSNEKGCKTFGNTSST